MKKVIVQRQKAVTRVMQIKETSKMIKNSSSYKVGHNNDDISELQKSQSNTETNLDETNDLNSS